MVGHRFLPLVKPQDSVMNIGRSISCMAAAIMIATLSTAIATERSEYVISAKIPGAGGAWDYAVVDNFDSRLYLAQGGVTALDLKSRVLTSALVHGGMTHGLAPLADGSVAVADAATRTITVFNGSTGKVNATIKTADANPVGGVHALDALVLEPKTGLLAAVNGEAGLVVLADIKSQSVVGTISIGGKPEFAVADGGGRIYINVEQDKSSEIMALDVPTRKVVGHIPLRGCDGPTGLAYDRETSLLMSVCENGVAKFVQARSGAEIASVPVGTGADALLFDSHRRRAFVPSADAGTLSVIAVPASGKITIVQTLKTQKGTRLGAVDSATGAIYLPAAKFGPPVPPIPYPSVVPGTFVILVATLAK
jgi:DNA-binding beta-propeller fold protein YncE